METYAMENRQAPTTAEEVSGAMETRGGVTPNIQSLFKSACRMAAIATTSLGVTVLLGWALDIGGLKSILPGAVTMKANTALGFLLSGASLWLQATEQPDLMRLRGARAATGCAVMVMLIGALTLAQYLFGTNLGIDQLLFTEPATAVQTSSPGRMAPNTALNFFLIGLSLLLLDRRPRVSFEPIQYLTIAVLLIGGLGFLGYLYGTTALYGIGAHTKMAVHTALGFVVLSLGVLSARPDQGLMSVISSHTAGGVLARRVLPVIVFVPPFLGWLLVKGAEYRLYDTELRMALFVTFTIVILSALVHSSSRRLVVMDHERIKLLAAIREAANSLASASSEILATTTQVASGAAETATTVNETTATVEEVKQTAQLASQKAKYVSENAQKVSQISQTGRKSAEDAVQGMHRIQEQMESIAESIVRLSEQGQAIGEIIATVNDIAEQSNLLAVNAAIEATKAGEQGKGFVVVAQEIKSLAEQSKQATAQVRTILGDIQKATAMAVLATEQGNKAVEAGVPQSAETGESIRLLAESITEAAQAATQIAASSQQQMVGMDQVAQAMESIKQASAQNVTGTKQAEVAAQSLHELGQKLKQLVAQNRV